MSEQTPNLITNVPGAEELAAAGQVDGDTMNLRHPAQLAAFNEARTQLGWAPAKAPSAERPDMVVENPGTPASFEPYVPSEIDKPVSRTELEALRAQIAAEQSGAPKVSAEDILAEHGDEIRRETLRQMGIAAADRKNREAAGLPPREHDLR